MSGPLGIVVMGVSGCGKSTLAAALGKHLEMDFLEGDRFHSSANVAKMVQAIPLTDEDRWPWLHSLGTALGEQARQKGTGLAACSALKRVYRDRLRESAAVPLRFLCLTGSRDVLLARMAARKGHYMPVALLDSQLATLELPHPDEDALVIDVNASNEALLHRAVAAIAR